MTKQRPDSPEALDALMKQHLTPHLERLAEEYGVITVAVCAVEHSDLCHVASNMDSHDTAHALAAALQSYTPRPTHFDS